MDEPVEDKDFSDKEKELITDSLHNCVLFLRECKVINEKPSLNHSSSQAISLGTELARMIIKTVLDMTFEDDEELFLQDENIQEDLEKDETPPSQMETFFSETPSSDGYTSSQSYYEPENKQVDYIPLEYKIKAVNLAREHPNWKLVTLQKNGCSRLTRFDELIQWRKHIAKGGTDYDKYQHIDHWTYQRFIEHRDRKKPVYTRDIRVWAMQSAAQFQSEKFHFKASEPWVIKFKNRHRIRMRKVTRYIKPTEMRSLEDTIQAAEDFQSECARAIPKYNLDYVINTDQIGCEYRVNSQRTLTYKGSKTVEAYIGDLNKVSHSYTAQYSITASGKLLPTVFVCLQEPKGSFGPVIQKDIDRLVAEYGNVSVTCSKSGKLTTEIVGTYVSSVLKPYVKEKFLLVQDSWGGQSQKHLSSLLDNLGLEYEVQIIPPGCTRFAQPLDVYCHRQIKKLIKRMQEATELLMTDRQISSRSDAIKIHSLIHYQVSAPIFQEMLEYAWYASKLIADRNFFFNVNQVCFSPENVKQKCYVNNCDEICFIRCSWCRRYVCFSCFYDGYHPKTCTK